MDVKRVGLLVAAVAIVGGASYGATHSAFAHDRHQGRHIGPSRPDRSQAPKFTPIAPADAPKFTPIAPANPPKFTPIAPANPPAGSDVRSGRPGS